MWLRAPDVQRLADKCDVAGLRKALTHARPDIRASAATALARTDPAGSLEPVRAVLVKDTAPEVRTSAARALLVVGTDRAIDVLGAVAVTYLEPEAVRPAVTALVEGAATDERCVAQLARAAHRMQAGHLRPGVVRALGRLASPQALVAVSEALSDSSPAVREAALEALLDRSGAGPAEPGRREQPPLRLPAQPAVPVRSMTGVPEEIQARCAVADRRWKWAAALGAPAVDPLKGVLEALLDEATRTTVPLSAVQRRDWRDAALTLGRVDDPQVAHVLTSLLGPAVGERHLDLAHALVEALTSGSRELSAEVAGQVLAVAVSVVTDADAAARALAQGQSDPVVVGQVTSWVRHRGVEPEAYLDQLRDRAGWLLQLAVRHWPADDPTRETALRSALGQVEHALAPLSDAPEDRYEAYAIADTDSAYRRLAGKAARAQHLRQARSDLLTALGEPGS